MDLDDLYAVVPAAQEEDLLEEVARDRLRLQWDELAGAWTAWPSAVVRVRDVLVGDLPEPADEPPAVREPVALTDGQVLGLVEHLLGAEVLEVRRDEVERLSAPPR